MNYFKPPFIFSIALFFLNQVYINAQTITDITPNNLGSSVQEIKDMYGDLINATSNDIKAFYLQHWNNNPSVFYDSGCQPAQVLIEDVSNNEVTLSIVTTPSTGRTISYINLLNPDDQFTVALFSTTNSFTIPIPEDGPYLFAFQNSCGIRGSVLDIIIIDKILLHLKSGESCLCSSPSTLSGERNEDEESVNYSFVINQEEDDIKYYSFLIEALNGLETPYKTKFRFKTTYSDEILYVNYYDDCLQNIKRHEEEIDGELQPHHFYVHPEDDPNTAVGTFGFNPTAENDLELSVNFNYSLMPPPLHYTADDVTVRLLRCYQEASTDRRSTMIIGGNESDRPALFITPNPIVDETEINYQIQMKDHVSIFLFDVLGNRIKTIKNSSLTEAGSYQEKIDLSDLQSGLYFCVLNTKSKTITRRISKL